MCRLRHPRSLPYRRDDRTTAAVQVMQVPRDRRVLPVDLQCVQRLVPARVRVAQTWPATRSEPPPKTGWHHRFPPAHLAVRLCFRSLMNVSSPPILRRSAVQPHRRIDAVRQQVARNAAPRHRRHRAAKSSRLRQILRNGPVLEEFARCERCAPAALRRSTVSPSCARNAERGGASPRTGFRRTP